MGRLLRKLAGISAIAVAVTMTWSAPAEAIPTFSITPDPASAAPGGSVDLVLSVSGATDLAGWFGFVIAFGPPVDELQPQDLYAKLDTTSGLVAGSLLGAPGASFEMVGLLVEDGATACGDALSCVSVFDFAGLNGESGELLKFRMNVLPGTPPGDFLVKYAMNHTGTPEAGQQFTIIAVPEPSSYYLFAAGVLLLALSRLPRFQRAAARVS